MGLKLQTPEEFSARMAPMLQGWAILMVQRLKKNELFSNEVQARLLQKVSAATLNDAPSVQLNYAQIQEFAIQAVCELYLRERSSAESAVQEPHAPQISGHEPGPRITDHE